MAFAVPVRNLSQQKPISGASGESRASTASSFLQAAPRLGFSKKPYSSIHDLPEGDDDFLPAELFVPSVSLEITIKMQNPLPPVHFPSGQEGMRRLQEVIRGAETHQLEVVVTPNGVSSGLRRFTEGLEAQVALVYREWTEAATELQARVVASPVECPYFMAVHRQQSDAVYYFAKGSFSVVAAEGVLRALCAACEAAHLHVARNGPHSITVLGVGYASAIGLSLLFDSVEACIGTRLPLLLAPFSFTGALCKRPTVRTWEDEKSLYGTSRHCYVRLAGMRILPHVLADIFRACRALGPTEVDINPGGASLVSAASLPFSTAWTRRVEARQGKLLSSGDMESSEEGEEEEEGMGEGEGVEVAEQFCVKRFVVNSKQVQLSGVACKVPM